MKPFFLAIIIFATDHFTKRRAEAIAILGVDVIIEEGLLFWWWFGNGLNRFLFLLGGSHRLVLGQFVLDFILEIIFYHLVAVIHD